MEPAALFFTALFGIHALSILLLFVILIKAILNFKKETPSSPLILEIIGFVLFAPTSFLLFSYPDIGGAIIPGWILYSLLGTYFLLFFLVKNRVSTLLAVTGLILLYAELLFSYGTQLPLLTFLNQSFVQTANKLVTIGNTPWFYFALWITAGLFVVVAALYTLAKNESRKALKICLLTGGILIIIGIGRDFIVFNKVTQSGKSAIDTSEIHKFVFQRDNDLYLTDTSGKATPEKLTNLPKDHTTNKAKISPDEKYLAYTVTDAGTDRAEFELNLMDLQTKQPQKIFDAKNSDRLGEVLDFSNTNFLAYSIQPGYMDKINTMGTPINPDPSTLTNIRVIDNTGKEVNKIIDFERGVWIDKDLVLIKRHQDSNAPADMPSAFNMSPITDIYLSAEGRGQPEKIGEINISTVEASTRIFAKQPDELIFKTGSKNNPGNLGFAPMDYFSFNIRSKELTQVSLPELTSPLTSFSADMKYYTQQTVVPKSLFIKSVDGSITTDITELGTLGGFWLGHQFLCSTPEGLKVASLDGKLINITDNPTDRVIYESTY